MSVKKMVKEIKHYGHKFDYKYGGGYFVLSFDPDDYNLHIVFKELPDIRIGIWKCKDYDNGGYFFFAEHKSFIDKFKPSAVRFNFKSLIHLMAWAELMMWDKEFYDSQIKEAYKFDSIPDIEEYIRETRDRDQYNGLTKGEYDESLKKFNKLVESIDVEKMDLIWRRSDGYRELYDVWYSYDNEKCTEQELDALDKAIIECNCSTFFDRLLPAHFWKKRKEYNVKCHPSMKNIYSDKGRYNRYHKVKSKYSWPGIVTKTI